MSEDFGSIAEKPQELNSSVQQPNKEYLRPPKEETVYSYRNSYREANTISQWLLLYCNHMVTAVTSNKGVLPLSAIENIDTRPNEMHELNERLKAAIKQSQERSPSRDTYYHVRNGIWDVFKWNWIYVGSVAIFSECLGVYQSLYIVHLADFIRSDQDFHWSEGLWRVALFVIMNFITLLTRNRYIFFGYMTGIKMRRQICNLMYDKVTSLSVESLQKTDAGKLVTLISNDMFSIERQI